MTVASLSLSLPLARLDLRVVSNEEVLHVINGISMCEVNCCCVCVMDLSNLLLSVSIRADRQRP